MEILLYNRDVMVPLYTSVFGIFKIAISYESKECSKNVLKLNRTFVKI